MTDDTTLRAALEKLLADYAVFSATPSGPMTIKEFCRRENISSATFYKMAREGTGPQVDRLPNMKLQRIALASYKAWKTVQAARQKEMAPLIEAQRLVRVERNTAAAKKAVLSPLHPCNKNRKRP
jgi:hypothetical protein